MYEHQRPPLFPLHTATEKSPDPLPESPPHPFAFKNPRSPLSSAPHRSFPRLLTACSSVPSSPTRAARIAAQSLPYPITIALPFLPVCLPAPAAEGDPEK